MDKNNKVFDVIIIGGGAAGLSTALWCDELGFSTLLLEKRAEFGGQLLQIYNRIENHLGIEAENGRELRDIFVRQTEKRKFLSRLNAGIAQIDIQNKKVFLTGGATFSADFIVIATGVRRRKLNVEGEKNFAEKGILKSGKNERETVRNKSVLIVGGGDAALENSLILAETAAEVFVVHRRAEFRGRSEFLKKARKNPKISLLTNTVVTKINGVQEIESADVENIQTKQTNNLKIENILIRIGVEPNTKFLHGSLKLDESGYIEVDQFCETGKKGIFAVGDVANSISPTISTAAGMGATAAKAIRNRLS